MTEGPYYLDVNLIRRDITEGRPGVPLALSLTVERASTCKPIKGATVEIWHCDAGGTYSSGKAHFLRGGQRSGSTGKARIDTIYPGWYHGRTPHIHVKVHVGGKEVHTGQLFFSDTVTAAVYKRSPYSRRGAPDTTNRTDGIYRSGGSRSMVALTKSGSGYRGRMTLIVQA
jgi:protocatechuate 3,4-dioxygenase beta subunit